MFFFLLRYRKYVGEEEEMNVVQAARQDPQCPLLPAYRNAYKKLLTDFVSRGQF